MAKKKQLSNYKKGGHMAYCKDGGEIDFTYIFSKDLGTADKTQKVMKDLGGRMPSDYLHVVSGPNHPSNGSQGGAQFDSSMRPVDNSTLKFNGATAGNRSVNRTTTQPGAVAFLENGETFINPKYKKGVLPYGVDPIAKNTADRLFAGIEVENETLRTKGQKIPMQFGWGGYAADEGLAAANEVSGNKMNGEGLGMATDAISGITGAVTGLAGMAGQMKSDSEDPSVSTKTKRLNAASSGLAASAAAIQAVPVVGQIGGAVLGLASGITKAFAGKSAKKDKWQEDYSNLPMAVTQNTAGNAVQGYAKGGKMPMYKKGKDTAWWIDETNPDVNLQGDYPMPDLATIPTNKVQSTYPNWGFKLPPAPGNIGEFGPQVQSGYNVGTTPNYSPTTGVPPQHTYPPNKDGKKFSWAKDQPAVQPDQFGMTKGDKMLLSSMLPATLFNAANFAAGYDREKAILNPEANKVKELMKQNIDFQAMQNEARAERNRGERIMRGSVNNSAVERANLQQMMANSARVTSGINLQGQMAQNQLDTSRAQMLDQLGRETMQAKETARELTARNKGVWQGFGAATAENIGEGLSRTGTAMNTREMNNLKIGILNSLPGNYSTSKEQIMKVMEGMPEEKLIEFGKALGIKV